MTEFVGTCSVCIPILLRSAAPWVFMETNHFHIAQTNMYFFISENTLALQDEKKKIWNGNVDSVDQKSDCAFCAV